MVFPKAIVLFAIDESVIAFKVGLSINFPASRAITIGDITSAVV